jgi:hypothetical protein
MRATITILAGLVGLMSVSAQASPVTPGKDPPTELGSAPPIDQSAVLEGAIQYPPLSVGEDAQPPAPARTVKPLASPRVIIMSVSASSVAPSLQPFFIRPSIRWGEPN